MTRRSNQASPVISCCPVETRWISWSVQASGTRNSKLKSRIRWHPKNARFHLDPWAVAAGSVWPTWAPLAYPGYRMDSTPQSVSTGIEEQFLV